MTYVSPLLAATLANKNKMNSNDLNYDKIYEDLKLRANEVRPNVAKAKLIKETPLQATVSYFKDLKQDAVNFTTAVKTGKMNDNSLGRLNDFGLKIGALGIATFLAAHSKTKKDAIMQFVGGGAFLASMAAWPKIFINLPARIVHGFDIGQRYISAQGDKKDFFLDNQFLPWDAYSKEEITEIGKRMGIDINEKDGEEKIKRKMQKTALQNRTLWMATAGFSTPLMTAMIGNAVEPLVEDAVVNHDFKKAANVFANPNRLQGVITSAQPIVRNTEELAELFAGNQGIVLEDSFFEKLANLLKIDDLKETFKDPDDVKILEKFETSERTARFSRELRKIADEQVQVLDLKDGLAKLLSSARKVEQSQLATRFSPDKIETLVGELFEDKTSVSKEKLAEFFSKKGIVSAAAERLTGVTAELTREDALAILAKRGLTSDENKKILEGATDIKAALVEIASATPKRMAIGLLQDIKAFSSGVSEITPDFVRNLLANVELPSAKVVLSEDNIKDIIEQMTSNPSIANLRKILSEYNIDKESQEAIFSGLKVDNSRFFEYIKKFNLEELSYLRGRIKETLKLINPVVGSKAESVTTKTYKHTLKKLFNGLGLSEKQLDKVRTEEVFSKGGAKDILIEHFQGSVSAIFDKKAASESEAAYKVLIQKLAGVNPNKGFRETAKTIENTDFSSIVRPANNGFVGLIDALVGKDSKVGSLSRVIKNHVGTKQIDMDAIRSQAIICANFERRLAMNEFKDLDQAAIQTIRNLIYAGGAAMRENEGQIGNKELYAKYIRRIFNPEAFELESSVIPDIKEVVARLADPKKVGCDYDSNYFKSLDFASFIKKAASEVYNSKAWMKRFGIMSAALVAVTLLVQPLFGNIKKEFTSQGNGGTK